ncbi:MAG: imelysin family protein [Alphaproteobacteria bacterium]|nr:imelysin family protein [Alphaproteobacteria bacterium]
MATVVGSADWRSWVALGALAGLAFAQPLACDRGAGDSGGASAQVAALLAQVGPGVVVPALDRAQATLPPLRTAIEGWQAAIGTDGEAAARAAAQDAWRDSFLAWQQVELMQIGPAGSSLTVVGGQDLRDEIYSWPTVNACRVDQETVEAEWDAADFFSANLVNVYGHDALEHLLFAGDDNACPGEVEINSDGSWDTLGADGVAANRAAYALAVVDQLSADTDALESAWASGWSDVLADGADPYDGQQAALNAVFDGLFYLDTHTKDRKLAQPLGLDDCAETTCPDDVEALLSDASLDAIVENLDAFRTLFTGGDGAGFDDLLVDAGHGDLSDRILGQVDTALAAADAIDVPLSQAVADPDAAVYADVVALHDAISAIDDDLKGDLATVLALVVPAEAAGDAD